MIQPHLQMSLLGRSAPPASTGIRAIDLFAGWGGFTLGAEQAGIEVVWAANHWPLAVRAHALNHPRTQHSCQDLRQADWTALPAFDVLLASPACQGHSQASQPKRRRYHDAQRATAWAVIDCAEVTRPRALIIENVLDFRRWKLYPLWRQALTELGYQLQELNLTASHHGVPQRRTRLFIVGMQGRAPGLELAPTTEPAFGPHIDWTAGRWRLVANTSIAARTRIQRAQTRHGQRCLSQHVTNHPGIGLDEPIRTITTKDQWIAVDGDRYRPLTIREYATAMGFPSDYAWPADAARSDAIRGLGNAVCPPVASALLDAIVGRWRQEQGRAAA